MNESEILKLLDLIIGETSAYGDHGIDMDRIVPNIDLLGRVSTELASKLNYIAHSYENRQEDSVKACGKKARYWIDFIEKEVFEVER